MSVMERIGTLINKLKEQLEQGADATSLLMNTRLLLAELQTQLQQNPVPIKGKVSVVMPGSFETKSLTPEAEEVVATQIALPAQENTITQHQAPSVADTNWAMNIPVEIPTLVHQASTGTAKEVYELNQMLVTKFEQPEINERLREDKTEVAAVLQAAPVRDLKKAVGINDRYLFVNELFRGDESMYERSMKTINRFSIYPEAQYWIERELKVKMGWDEGCETVKLFDQLVRRRFA
ncbi:MAG: hypothetical protein IBJ16_07270 [Chitinophagaceae bacterium]|nr:hypothetical protein [Chitinophagaceae bacterium]